MADELGAELSLDLDSARRDIEGFSRDVADELERAVSSFSDEYERAVASLPTIEPDIDAASVTTELERAIQSTDPTLEVTPDATAITSGISEAVGAADTVVTPGLDAEPLTASLIDAVESVHPEISPTVDTTEAEAALLSLGDAAGGASGGISDAALQAQDLNDTLSDLSSESGPVSDKLGTVSNVSTTLGTALAAAQGQGQSLVQRLGEMAPSLGKVAGPTLGVAAAFTALFTAGEHSLASFERVNTVLGDASSQIEHINVGGLNGKLGDLAVQAGVSGGALRNAAAQAAQVGLSSGASVPQVTNFANSVNALALRAVAMNPALGDAGSVAERLSTVLSRGGRYLARYGIDLTSAEITTRALADTGKTAVRDLTLFERSVAGADIAVEKLGTRLGTDFQKGTETATVRLKSMRAELSAAFASAGRPLVEPTINALGELADAGTEVSKALGSLAKASLPVVTTGLESLATAAGSAGEILGTIPGPVLAIGGALFALQKTMGATFGPGAIRSVGDVGAAFSLMTETVGGRSVIALAGLTALDQGLKAAGTSTKDLGIDMVTTGAAIGFAIGGPEGALLGAAAGGIGEMVAAESDLKKATDEVDKEFTRAKESSVNLQAALFTNADTAIGLASAIAGLDENLAKFVVDASAFKTLHAEKDLKALGLSTADLVDLLRQGDEGFAKFIARAQGAGKVATDIGKIVADSLQVETGGRRNVDEEFSKRVSNLIQSGGQLGNFATEVSKRLRDLGVSAQLSAEDFVNLTHTQQRNVLALLQESGESTKLLVAFRETERATRATEKAQFDLFATTNHLSPVIVEAARAASRGADGSVDWAKALGLVSDAARGIVPELGFMTQETALAVGGMNRLSDATDTAAKAIPGLDAALSKGLDTSFFEKGFTLPPTLISGEIKIPDNFLDTDKLLGSLNETAAATKKFFTDIQTIADAGASNTAAALLKLGPDNLGARMAADLAANAPFFRDGMEKAFEGLAQGQIAGEKILGEMRARVDFLAANIGTTFGQRLATQFGVTDITKLTSAQIAAFIQTYGDGGDPAAKAFMNSFNQEIVAEKIAGIDTTPLTDSVEAAKDSMGRTFDGIPKDLETANAATQVQIDSMKKAFDAVGPAVDASLLPVPTSVDEAMLQSQAEINAATPLIKQATQFAFTPIGQEVDAALLPVPTSVDEAMLQSQAAINANTPGFAEAGRNFGSSGGAAVASGLTSQQQATAEAAGGLSGAVTYIMSLLPGQMEGLGADAVRGFARGIYLHRNEASQAAADFAAQAAAAAEGKIEPGSPSRVFMRIGRTIPEGLALGIRQTQDVAIRAAESMAAAVIAAQDVALDKATRVIDPKYAGDPMKEAKYSEGIVNPAVPRGGAPVPPAGAAPISVQVVLDPSMLPPAMDRSLNYGGVHIANYGPDSDTRGLATIRRLRDVAHLSGY